MSISKSVLAICGLNLFLWGCGESRKVQCNTLGEAHNQVRQTIMAEHQKGIGQPAYSQERYLQLSQVTLQAAQTMNTVNVSDNQLQAFRSRFVESYANSSQIYQQLADLMPATGSPTEAVMQRADALRGQVDKGIPELINEVTIYCIGGS